MAELKTKKNNASVSKFLKGVSNEQRKNDGLELLKIFESITGEKARMWGDSIVGFGQYHYKSDRSKQEGDWPLTGFSPRKASMSIYIMPGLKNYPELCKKLGKYKYSVSCLYVNKLSDIDINVLKKLIKQSVKDMKKKYG